MEINKMKVGVFGLRPEFIEKLRNIFGTVEVVSLYKEVKYDLLFFDISYASQRVAQFIALRFPIPMVFSSYYDDSYERFNFLPEASYLKWNVHEEFDEEDFKNNLLIYLSLFDMGKDTMKIDPELVQRSKNEFDAKRKAVIDAFIKPSLAVPSEQGVEIMDEECNELENKRHTAWRSWINKRKGLISGF